MGKNKRRKTQRKLVQIGKKIFRSTIEDILDEDKYK